MHILFIHAGMTQFRALHEYINAHTSSVSWLLCSRSKWRAHRDQIGNLIPFDDPSEDKDTYFYVRKLAGRVKRAFKIREAVLSHLDKHKIDVLVVHGSGGFPLQLYDAIPCPIVSYIEFPSFRAHGYDPKYPPPEANMYRDKLFEMANLHQAVRSDLVIVPSLYAKAMFPQLLHSKIHAQMDGLDVAPGEPSPRHAGEEFRIGFVARDLSSAKGVEHFITVAKEIHRARPRCRFLICGSKRLRYSYEDHFLKSVDGLPEGTAFLDYLFKREGIDPAEGIFRHLEFLAYEKYAEFIGDLDLVHYPLQFGSANWGIFECLFRGKKIIASNRCFIPEVIKDGYNGFLCEYGDTAAWVRRTIEIIDNPGSYHFLGRNAIDDAGRRFHVSVVAQNYLKTLQTLI